MTNIPKEVVVLLVDDEILLVRILRRALSDDSYTLICVTSSAAALDVLEKLKTNVRLLVTDFYLDGPLTGLELERVARNYNPKIRTLFVSGAFLEDSEINDRLLPKPFRVDDLRARIKREIQESLAEY